MGLHSVGWTSRGAKKNGDVYILIAHTCLLSSCTPLPHSPEIGPSLALRTKPTTSAASGLAVAYIPVYHHSISAGTFVSPAATAPEAQRCIAFPAKHRTRVGLQAPQLLQGRWLTSAQACCAITGISMQLRPSSGPGLPRSTLTAASFASRASTAARPLPWLPHSKHP